MITYPVAEDSRWAIWSISQSKILKHNHAWFRADGGEIVGLDADIVPLLEVQLDQPVYDDAAEKLVRSDPVVDVNANTHTHGWDIVALTQDELDAKATQAADTAERDVVKGLYQDLKDGVGTQGERLLRVEKVLARLLKDNYVG